MPVSLPQNEKKSVFFIIIYKCSNEDFDQHMVFCTYHIWDSDDTVGLNSGLSLNLHLFFVYGSSDDSDKSIHLLMLD